MTHRFILPLGLAAAAVGAVVPSAASAQWYGGYGYPDTSYHGYNGSRDYGERYFYNDNAWRHGYRDRRCWDRDECRNEYRHYYYNYRGHQHRHSDDEDDDD